MKVKEGRELILFPNIQKFPHWKETKIFGKYALTGYHTSREIFDDIKRRVENNRWIPDSLFDSVKEVFIKHDPFLELLKYNLIGSKELKERNLEKFSPFLINDIKAKELNLFAFRQSFFTKWIFDDKVLKWKFDDRVFKVFEYKKYADQLNYSPEKKELAEKLLTRLHDIDENVMDEYFEERTFANDNWCIPDKFKLPIVDKLINKAKKADLNRNVIDWSHSDMEIQSHINRIVVTERDKNIIFPFIEWDQKWLNDQLYRRLVPEFASNKAHFKMNMINFKEEMDANVYKKIWLSNNNDIRESLETGFLENRVEFNCDFTRFLRTWYEENYRVHPIPSEIAHVKQKLTYQINRNCSGKNILDF